MRAIDEQGNILIDFHTNCTNTMKNTTRTRDSKRRTSLLISNGSSVDARIIEKDPIDLMSIKFFSDHKIRRRKRKIEEKKLVHQSL